MYRYIIGTLLVGVCVSLLGLFDGCSHIPIPRPPSVCDKPINQETILCETAKKLDVHLEITGEVLASINSDAITSGVYSKAQAIAGIEKLRSLGHLAAGQIDVSELGLKASEMISKYRTLRLGTRVILIYLSQYGHGRFFTDQDVIWWDYWCDQLLADVNSLEASG